MRSQRPRQERDLKRQGRGLAESSLTWEDARVNGIQEFRKGIPVLRPKVGRRYWGRVFLSKARHRGPDKSRPIVYTSQGGKDYRFRGCR